MSPSNPCGLIHVRPRTGRPIASDTVCSVYPSLFIPPIFLCGCEIVRGKQNRLSISDPGHLALLFKLRLMKTIVFEAGTTWHKFCQISLRFFCAPQPKHTHTPRQNRATCGFPRRIPKHPPGAEKTQPCTFVSQILRECFLKRCANFSASGRSSYTFRQQEIFLTV